MWTTEAIAEVKKYVDSGLSRGAIARIYGTTRNAVVGLCYRHGITGPNNQFVGALVANERKRRANLLRSANRSDAEPIKTRARWLAKAKAQAYKAIELPFAPDEPEPLRVSLLDLTDSHCHWVCDDTDDNCLPTYCGHLVARGPMARGSWCAHHYNRVYTR